jgi:curli biogenesis system outer membrane secretion channel CsgG
MTEKFLRPGALLLLALLAAGCFNPAAVQKMQEANWAYSMSPNFKMDRTWRIAILPPTVDKAGTSGLEDHAGLLLMKPGRFSLVDRSEVDRILQEQQFGSSGVVDPGTAAKLGKLMGAEGVMIVNITSLKHDEFFKDSPDQRDAQLYVKIISVETAEVLYYAQGTGSSFEGPAAALDGALDTALGPLIKKGSQQ